LTRPKSRSIAAIAKAVVKFEDKGRALKYINKLIGVIDKMPDEYNKLRSIAAITYSQSKIGLFSDLIQNIKNILMERDRYLSYIIYNMFKSGDKKYFKKLISECSYYISSRYATIGILFYLYKDQRKDLSDIIVDLIQ